MKSLRYCVLSLSIAAWFQASICPAQDARQVAQQVLPSVVVVKTYDSEGHSVGLASGFFVSTNIVATNFHVIDGASQANIRVVGNPKTYQVSGIVAFSKERDLVLLQVPNVGGTPLILAGDNQTEIGEEIYALGNPEGLEGTISPGIVSSAGTRRIEGEDVIQVTAPISHGSSGGPVVNKKGEVIGVAEGFLSEGQNLNFAVPVRYLVSLLKQIGPLQLFSSVTSPRAAGSSEETPTDWLLIASSNDLAIYYSPKHVEPSQANTFRVWIKAVPKTNAVREELSAADGDEPPLIASKYGYGLTRQEYDCRQSTYRELWTADYDTDGKRLRSTDMPADRRTWIRVGEPDSFTALMRKKICASTSEGESSEQDLVGTYTGTWASDSYNVSGSLALTMRIVNGQVEAAAVFTGSEYLNQDTLIVSLTPMGSGVWKMDYKGKKSKITGTGIFRNGRFVGDYRYKKFLWVDRGRWNLQK